MNIHFSQCLLFREMIQFFAIPNDNDDLSDLNLNIKEHFVNACLSNYEILDYNISWSQLCFLEAFYIKQLSPYINKGIKATKDLQLFR